MLVGVMRSATQLKLRPHVSPTGRLVLRSLTMLSLVVFVLGICACAPKRPALYQNEKTASVGDARAQLDIDQCTAQAKTAGYGRSGAGDAAVSTTTGAAAGAAIGAATGAVRGRAGRGAATGAAGGAVGGMLRSIFRSRDPGPILRRYVEECLSEKGYKTIGWK